MSRRARAAAAIPTALCAALLAAGCGATPPQVPVGDAERVAAALTGIAETCGQMYQREGPRPHGAPPASLRAAASMRSRELANAFAGNARRIYQSHTMAQVAALAVDYLRECGLRGVASQLRRETTSAARSRT